MSLLPGTKFGQYDIVAPIGAGGMGEVYRATDEKLGRSVAIKILPELFARDPERLARFDREAKTLAALNHPNIAVIHEMTSGVISGAPGQEITPDVIIRALVMELVDGEDLSQLSARGPMALADMLPIARQIADALEAAHEHGIIHRDLKPANVKVRGDGTVKVLDFGLAKAIAPDTGSGGADAMNSPTMTSPATAMGMILGTAAYMSPEQAKGRPVDRRADVWAFGCVLFELLTGTSPFKGEDISDTLANVLKNAPDWSALPKGLPASIERLLHRCLEKDPRKRLSAIGDARLELDEREAAPAAATAADKSRWTISRVAMVAAIALVVGAAGTWFATRVFQAAPSVVVTRSSILPDVHAPVSPDATSVAISPDGRMVAFITSAASETIGQLWVRPIDGLAPRMIAGAADALQPFWSPDSRQIAFFTNDKLKRVAVDGGRAEEVCDVQDPRGGAWSSADVIVFAPANAGGLMRVAASGGTPAPATALDKTRGETGHRFPAFLPDGDHFLYAALPAHAGTFDIFVGSLTSKTQDFLLKAESAPVYSPPGYLLFERRGGLVAEHFDPARRTVSGEPLLLDDQPGGVGLEYVGSPAASASAAGTLAYLASPPVNTSLVQFDTSGRQIGAVDVPPGHYEEIALSPDGTRAVAMRRSSPTVTDLWMIDLVRGGATRFTNDPGVTYFAVWSPDGQRIAFSSSRDGPEAMFIKSANGTGAEELLYKTTSLFKQPQSWSPDGKYIVFVDLSPTTNSDIWVIPVSGDRTPFPYAQSPAREQGGQISPDGHWMAYVSDETGRFEAYVQSFPTAGRKFRVTTGGASAVWWRKDSKQLLLVNADETDVLVADVQPGTDFFTTAPRVIGHLPKGLLGVDANPDRQRLLALVTEGGNVNLSVTIVQNWAASLAKK